jgi:hypothetical protein
MMLSGNENMGLRVDRTVHVGKLLERCLPLVLVHTLSIQVLLILLSVQSSLTLRSNASRIAHRYPQCLMSNLVLGSMDGQSSDHLSLYVLVDGTFLASVRWKPGIDGAHRRRKQSMDV